MVGTLFGSVEGEEAALAVILSGSGRVSTVCGMWYVWVVESHFDR